jgi:DNA polymerase I-like protein with 3'-5' exonuclease and polymerase domains
MLIQVDAKALEWVVCSYLSQDQVAINELVNQFDIHTDNQQLFGFPSRGIAKIFIFRLIYGGSAYSYAHDPEFMVVSTKEWFWQEAIDKFYSKYQGVREWHDKLMIDVPRTGIYRLPTGREYEFKPVLRRGSYDWPRTTILNYPVQGLAAELMAIARVSAYRRLGHLPGVLFVNTVHDNIILDVVNDDKLIHQCCTTLKQVLQDVPRNFEKMFKVPFNVPLTGELEIGMNWGEVEKYPI